MASTLSHPQIEAAEIHRVLETMLYDAKDTLRISDHDKRQILGLNMRAIMQANGTWETSAE